MHTYIHQLLSAGRKTYKNSHFLFFIITKPNPRMGCNLNVDWTILLAPKSCTRALVRNADTHIKCSSITKAWVKSQKRRSNHTAVDYVNPPKENACNGFWWFSSPCFSSGLYITRIRICLILYIDTVWYLRALQPANKRRKIRVRLKKDPSEAEDVGIALYNINNNTAREKTKQKTRCVNLCVARERVEARFPAVFFQTLP